MGIEIPVLIILQRGVVMFTHKKFINHVMDALLYYAEHDYHGAL